MSTGIYYTPAELRPALLKPARLGEHVWVAVAAFRIAPESLRGKGADQIHMDRENLASIDVGCYVCEQPWAERLSYRDCPGEPVPPMAPVA